MSQSCMVSAKRTNVPGMKQYQGRHPNPYFGFPPRRPFMPGPAFYPAYGYGCTLLQSWCCLYGISIGSAELSAVVFGVSLLLLILLVKVPLPFVSCWPCLSFYTSVGHVYKMNKRSDADCRGQIVAQ